MATSNRHQKKLPKQSRIKGSDFLNDLVCKPCHFDDIAKPAFGYCTDCREHLCSMCFINHKKLRASRYHKLLDSRSMPQTQTLHDTDTSAEGGPSDSLTTPCEKHSQEYIKFYCNTHEVLLCNVCVTLKHKMFCSVDYIPDVSLTELKSDILREINARAQSLEAKCDLAKNGMSRDAQRTMNSLKKSLSDLKKYRSDINGKLDSQEKEITKQINDLTEENSSKEKTIKTKCEFMKSTVKSKKDTLNRIYKSKQPNQLFISLQQTKAILDEYEKSLLSFERQRRLEYQFIPSTSLKKLLEAVNALGTISSNQDDLFPVLPPEDTISLSSDSDDYRDY